MSEIVSSIKPSGSDYEEKPIVDDTKIWASKVQTKKAFKDHGFDVGLYNDCLEPSPDSMSIWRNVSAEIFFAKVDITKEPITQIIDVMHRQRALEHYKGKDGRDKARVKEFLIYNVRLGGLDWLGNPINAHLEYEGRCDEPQKRVSVTVDEKGRQHAKYVMHGTRDKFYIPFTKKTVDDLLEKTGTDRNNIKYYGKFAHGPNVTTVSFRNGDYSYEQFVKQIGKTFKNYQQDKVDQQVK